MRYEHILRLEELLPIEIDRSVGIQPLKEEVNRRTLELLGTEGEGASIVPVPPPYPLDRVFGETVIWVGELPQTDEVLLYDPRDSGRMDLPTAVFAEGPATAKGQRIGGKSKGCCLSYHRGEQEKGAATKRAEEGTIHTKRSLVGRYSIYNVSGTKVVEKNKSGDAETRASVVA